MIYHFRFSIDFENARAVSIAVPFWESRDDRMRSTSNIVAKAELTQGCAWGPLTLVG